MKNTKPQYSALNRFAAICMATVMLLLGHASTALSAAELIPSSLSSQIQSATGLGTNDPVVIVATIINGVLTILGVVAVALIIYGGFVWMTAGGNEENVKKARGILKAAVIGLIIILASYGITLYVFSVIESATGQAAI